MLQLIKQLFDFARKNLKLTPQEIFLLTVKYLSEEIVPNIFEPFQSKIASLHNVPCPTASFEFMSFIGSRTV